MKCNIPLFKHRLFLMKHGHFFSYCGYCNVWRLVNEDFFLNVKIFF